MLKVAKAKWNFTLNKFFVTGYIPPPTLNKSSRLGLSAEEDEEYEETADLDTDNNGDTDSGDQNNTELDQDLIHSSTTEILHGTEESTTKTEQAPASVRFGYHL